MFKVAMLAALVLVAAPSWARSEPSFAAPSRSVLEQLKRQHQRKAWLRVTTDSTRWELRARRIDDEGLAGITVRRSAPRPPDPIDWSSIARIDVKDSRRRYGQATGMLLGGLSGIAGGGGGMAIGALVGMWLGGGVGGLIENERALYIAAPVAPEASSPVASSETPNAAAAPDSLKSAVVPDTASAVAPPEGLAALAQASEVERSTVWLVSQAAFSQPVGGFRPAGPSHAWGYEFQSSFVPAHAPIGARFDVGMVSYRGHHDGVSADVFGGGSSTPLTITTGTDLYWLMAGPQWGLKPRKSGGYLFGMIGVVHLRPQGVAHWSELTIYEMEGLPSNSTGFAAVAGGGFRYLVGESKSLAITTELDYQRRGDAEYVAEPGVDGGYPNPRFAARRGPVQTLTFQLGLARQWGRH